MIAQPWGGLSLTALSERLGVSYRSVESAVRAGRLRVDRRRHGAYIIRQDDLRAYVSGPGAWVTVHPREIVDAEIRAVAVAAWERAGRPRWYAAAHLAAHYAVGRTTIRDWRARRGWPAPDAWHWHGHGPSAGDWWLIWSGALPPPPDTRRRGYAMPGKRGRKARLVADVLAAVEVRGGPPGKGMSFWPGVAQAVGKSPEYVRKLYWEAVRQAAAD